MITDTPPFAAQREALGVSVRYVPSLHRIVASAGGGPLVAAGVSAARDSTAGATGTGAIRGPGNTTFTPPRVAHSAVVAGATTKLPSTQSATALAGGTTGAGVVADQSAAVLN